MLKRWLNKLTTNQQDALQHGLRLALACALALTVYHYFKLNIGYWVLITAIITVQANVGASVKRAKDRLFGTILGVLVGSFCLIVFPANFILLVVIALILIFLITYLAASSYIYAIFFGTILLILLLGQATHTAWQFSVYRIIDTLVGITIGLLVSYLIWPKNAKALLFKQASIALEEVRKAFLLIIEGFQTGQVNRQGFIEHHIAVERAIIAGRKLYEEYTYELGSVRLEIEAMYSILLNIEQINNILLTLKLALAYPHTRDAKLQEKVDQFVNLINSVCLTAHRAMIEHKPELLDPYMAEFSEKLKLYLVTPEQLRDLLSQQDYKEYKLILFVSNLRRLAIQINYIVESVRQLNIKKITH